MTRQDTEDPDEPAPNDAARAQTSSARRTDDRGVPIPETDLADADAVVRCPYCERPFRATERRDLHVGEAHGDICTDEERSAYEIAREDERDDLFMFHMKVVVALGVLYATFVLSYTALIGAFG